VARKRVRIGDRKFNIPVPFTNNVKTEVSFLPTGGTISAQGSAHSYEAGKVSGNELLAGIKLPRNTKVTAHEFSAEQFGTGIDSKNMNDKHWLEMMHKISADPSLADKIVVTHGTDSMALTAFFLSLTLPPELQKRKKVVLTGSMLPSNLPNADGPGNLSKAFTLAKSKKGAGVLTEMAGDVFKAPFFDKRHTSSVKAFKAVNSEMAGQVKKGKVSMARTQDVPTRTFDLSGLKQLPYVQVIEASPGTDPKFTQAFIQAAVDNKARGIVFAGTGNGTIDQEIEGTLKALAKGKKDILVVRASMAGEGEVVRNGHFKDDEFDVACAGRLPTAQHARVLAQVALAAADKESAGQSIDMAEVRRAFDDYQSPEHRNP